MLVIKAADPVEVDNGPIKASDMTLRDHFAGLAMQRLLDTRFINIVGALAIAEESYEVADAMIHARSKPQERSK